MKKGLVIGIFLLCVGAAQAQYGGRFYRLRPNRGPQQRRPQPRIQDNFKPTLNFTAGYGFPNLDKNEFLPFSNAYPGSTTQNGPWMGAVDYQFSRNMSIGVLATTGIVSRPYYDNYTNNLAFNGHLKNTAIMLDLIRYMPGSQAVTPYFRTAIGVNIWNTDYTYTDGSKVVQSTDEQPLAYQVSLGVKLNLSKQAGFFLEAGYGKYILAGGLSLKF